MDLNLIRSLETLALFVLFMGLVYLLYRKTDDKTFEDAANLPFVGDETSNKVESELIKDKDHE
ncbi:MAG: cbb3-type cytochrome c oxidase subunit 3 [Kangiellaceae bacterium]|nr:cbb3-type cytochrome c oxidase subunit 3 [Kangiellaceae bacterium]